MVENTRARARASKRRDAAERSVVDLDKMIRKAMGVLEEAQGDLDRLQELKEQALKQLGKAVDELEAMRPVEVRVDG